MGGTQKQKTYLGGSQQRERFDAYSGEVAVRPFPGPSRQEKVGVRGESGGGKRLLLNSSLPSRARGGQENVVEGKWGYGKREKGKS